MHIVVYGTEAIGDEFNAELMKRHFGCVEKLDFDWEEVDSYDLYHSVARAGVKAPFLYLTDIPLKDDDITAMSSDECRIVRFSDAMEEASRWYLCAGDLPPNMTSDEALIYAGIRKLCEVAHGNSVAGGWYHDPKTGEPIMRNYGEMIALMHSELSEALEADRKGLADDKLPDRPGVEVEFADTLVRIGDASGYRGYDVAGAVIAKMRFNSIRPDHKPGNRAKAGGRAY